MARGIFDEEEADGGKPEKRVRERGPKNEHAGGPSRGRDTELTLGTGAMLGIAFGLLLMCGLCFWLGYAVGHHGSALATATQPAAQTPAPDEEPLQGNGTIPKPSADAQAPLPQEPPGSDGTAPPAGDGDTNPAKDQQSPAAGQPNPPASSPATPPPAATPPVRSALPAAGSGSPGGPPTAAPAEPASPGPGSPASSPAVRPALPGAPGQFMVQVAAVSHNDDAGVLVNALRKRGYAASAQHEASDGLIHVRIGPFTTHDEANRMCARLLDDGYNAIVQP